MANKIEFTLIEPLLNALQQERVVTLATIDGELNIPNVTAISWVFAPDEGKILFSIDNRSKVIKNIQDNNNVVVSLFANESIYSISGKANVKTELLEGVPLKLALIEIHISEVRDVMFYGSKIVQEPMYDKTYDKQAAARLDSQVMDAMKKLS